MARKSSSRRSPGKTSKKVAAKQPVPSHRTGLQHFQHPDGFGAWLGYKVLEVNARKRTAVVELQVRPDHLSPSGRVHGGVISACFDAALGITIFPTLGPQDYIATVELKVNYLRPLYLSDRLRFETRLVFRGRTLAVTHGFLYRQGERKASAMASATMYVGTAQARTSQRGAKLKQEE